MPKASYVLKLVDVCKNRPFVIGGEQRGVLLVGSSWASVLLDATSLRSQIRSVSPRQMPSVARTGYFGGAILDCIQLLLGESVDADSGKSSKMTVPW
jgi:hypothetical protein